MEINNMIRRTFLFVSDDLDGEEDITNQEELQEYLDEGWEVESITPAPSTASVSANGNTGYWIVAPTVFIVLKKLMEYGSTQSSNSVLNNERKI